MEDRQAYETDLTDAEWNRLEPYHYFSLGAAKGFGSESNDTVREWVRQAAGREGQPAVAVLDRQSVRTREQGGRAATRDAFVTRRSNETSCATRSKF